MSSLPTKGRTIVLQPDADDCARLADELDVLSVSGLRAEVTVTRWQRDGVRLKGPLTANVKQTCVLTLEPMVSVVEAIIDALFIPDTSKLSRKTADNDTHAILIDPESDDAPEMFTPPELDIGGVVHEFLALSIDPYPRSTQSNDLADKTNFAADGSPVQEDKPNPFAVLAKLKNDGANDT